MVPRGSSSELNNSFGIHCLYFTSSVGRHVKTANYAPNNPLALPIMTRRAATGVLFIGRSERREPSLECR